MPLQIVKDDIVNIKCDAIVNAANSSLLGGGGVDGSIHAAAGPELLRECAGLGGCKTGEVKVTGAYGLAPVKYIIHTVGPIWGSNENDSELLASCYRNSLLKAAELGCESIAFPLISAGAYGCEPSVSYNIAREEIERFLYTDNNEMLVYVVIYGDGSPLSQNYEEIRRYIDAELERYSRRNYFGGSASREAVSRSRRRVLFSETDMFPIQEAEKTLYKKIRPEASVHRKAKSVVPPETAVSHEDCAQLSLEEYLKNVQVDETFSQMVLRVIDEKGMKDSDCYKAANIDRRVFSKLRSNPDYKPSKNTAIMLALGLRLNLNETADLLMKAGFALNPSSKQDLVVTWFIKRKKYNVLEVNLSLYDMDLPLLM